MIRFLQRQKARKGFTIIELIVVIAIIAVLAAIILPMVDGRRSRIQEANSTARDFYTAMQSVMTKFTTYEGPLSPTYQANPNHGEMRYFEEMGGNYPYMKKGTDTPETPKTAPETTSLYVEFVVRGNTIREVYTNAYEKDGSTDMDYDNGKGLYDLRKNHAAHKNTEFGKLLMAEIENRIKYQNGFYYAKVTYEKKEDTSTIPSKMEAETVKVSYTGYSRKRLPEPGELELGSYGNANLHFDEDNVLANGEIFGVCAPLKSGNVIGMAGTDLN